MRDGEGLFEAEPVEKKRPRARAAAAVDKRFRAFDPRLMVRLLIYGCTTGVRSSRAIQRKCVDDVAFRFLSADQAPDFRSIARFRPGSSCAARTAPEESGAC